MSNWRQDLPNANNPQRILALQAAINDARVSCQMAKLQGAELDDAVDTWGRVLAAVPTGKISELAIQAQRAKGSGYAVTASEIFDLWDRPQQVQRSARESQLQRTYHQEIGARTDEEEEMRVLQFQESERRRRAEHARNVDLMERGVCKCEQPGKLSEDGTRFMCATGACDFRWMNPDMIHVEIARLKDALGREWGTMPDAKLPEIHDRATVEYQAPAVTDDEIVDALRDGCRIDVEALGREDSISFGRYIVANIGVAGLNEHDALALWDEWRVLEPESIAPPVHRAVEVTG